MLEPYKRAAGPALLSLGMWVMVGLISTFLVGQIDGFRHDTPGGWTAYIIIVASAGAGLAGWHLVVFFQALQSGAFVHYHEEVALALHPRMRLPTGWVTSQWTQFSLRQKMVTHHRFLRMSAGQREVYLTLLADQLRTGTQNPSLANLVSMAENLAARDSSAAVPTTQKFWQTETFQPTFEGGWKRTLVCGCLTLLAGTALVIPSMAADHGKAVFTPQEVTVLETHNDGDGQTAALLPDGSVVMLHLDDGATGDAITVYQDEQGDYFATAVEDSLIGSILDTQGYLMVAGACIVAIAGLLAILVGESHAKRRKPATATVF